MSTPQSVAATVSPLAIQLRPGTAGDGCDLCGGPIAPDDRLHLTLSEGPGAVCRECGRKHAPSLTALLDLASAAERAGRIGRHNVFPPLSVLLDLARAAEDYVGSSARARHQAA